jgi:molybdopterin converting factor small subunit
MTRYHVETFARYAELLGSTSLAIELPNPTSATAVIAALRQLPGGDALPDQPLLAVNHTLPLADVSIGPADVLALLPPLAGG